MLYICGGRSFTSSRLGRKMYEVISCFKKIMDCTMYCGGDFEKEKKTGANVNIKSAIKHSNCLKNFLRNSASEFKDLLNDKKILKHIMCSETDVSLVVERSSRLHTAGLKYASKNNIPFVLEWKDNILSYGSSIFKLYAKFVERKKIIKADFILVESAVIKRQLIAEGVEGNKIYIAYNAVNPDEFKKDSISCEQVRRQLGFTSDDIVVGYVGSYAFYHDSIRMIKAAKLLKEKHVRNIKWLLIGDGRDKLLCENLARENGLLEETVIMLPFQKKEDIPAYLSAMDVTILPGSTDIICPIKVMEYMAAESVVLVPDYECNREIINDNNGLLFRPGDENSIVEQLLRIKDNKSLCAIMGAKARKTVIDKLTWEKTYGAALREIVKKIIPS